ncbi:hypothetical protein CJA_1229 [Cellvibrio japonicus Ueda107]|uniref:Uncharacterized protein n=1 Tax=Cellvibrio japonicus (strain Ueda107) TaxID=498211 RepID=B3PCB4_CELJU|nr:hypothetical protein CJA_1229 [Cellvibrio japonicus Ueda107]
MSPSGNIIACSASEISLEDELPLEDEWLDKLLLDEEVFGVVFFDCPLPPQDERKKAEGNASVAAIA